MLEGDFEYVFWTEAILAILIAFGVFTNYSTKILAILLLIEAFSIEHTLSLGVGKYA